MPNEIKLFGEIGKDVKTIDVKSQLDAMDQSQLLVVRIDSEGGNVFDGFSIYDAVKSYQGKKKAVIESTAFSAASFIAMACDEIEITENGYMMMHAPYLEVQGDDIAHAEASEILGKLKESYITAYESRSGMSRDQIAAMLSTDTFIDAKTAVDQGFADRILMPKATSRFAAAAKFKNMPQGVLELLRCNRPDAGDKRETTQEQTMSDTKPVAASLAEIKAAFPKAKPDFVLNCLERQMPMASVMTEMVSALENENMALKAELDNCKSQLSAKAEEEETMKAKAMEEEEAAKAKAKSGVKPVAKAKEGSPSASAKSLWNSAIQAKVASGIPKAKAAALVNRENPGLREQMLAEING